MEEAVYYDHFECDVCWAPIGTKSKLRIHKRKEHFECKTCENYFNDTNELNEHMIKRHKENSRKLGIEREPSLRNHKIKKTDGDVCHLFDN